MDNRAALPDGPFLLNRNSVRNSIGGILKTHKGGGKKG